jgi:hypothetical protein
LGHFGAPDLGFMQFGVSLILAWLLKTTFSTLFYGFVFALFDGVLNDS